jgi:ABC-type Fe3+/spermidine/putrescine transport system ATPase subunit
MSIGNRLAVMEAGNIVQLDIPRQIYDSPATRYVAEFIGQANLIEAEVVEIEGDTGKLATALGTLVFRRFSIPAKAVDDAAVGSRLLLMIRPESVKLLPTADPNVSGTNHFQATIDSATYTGSRTEYTCVAGDVELEAWDAGTAMLHQPGTKVWIEYPVEALHVVGQL